MDQNETTMHPFERTLGQGPYKFVAFFDLGQVIGALHAGNVGAYNNGLAMAPKVESGLGTCSHCGHAILNIYVVQIGNGKRYGVGSECIEKAGLPARELSAVKRAELKHKRDQRAALKVRKGAAARGEIKALIESQTDTLKALPHPSVDGLNLLNYATYTLDRSSDGGVVFALKRIKTLLKNSENNTKVQSSATDK